MEKKVLIDYGRVIVVLQRGWVLVGDLTREKNDCLLKNASVIRTWGTTNGLGELALTGPTSSTKLDKCTDIHFHYLTMCFLMEVKNEKL
jgi:hypothetical protein